MVKIHVFRNKNESEVIEEMSKYSFRRTMGLLISPGRKINNGDFIELSKTREGKIIKQRSRVFIFWRKEYLVRQESDHGQVYGWYNASEIIFV